MLSFDEFRAINNREKAKASVTFSDTSKPSDVKKAATQTAKSESTPENRSMSWTGSIGAFLELHSMQMVYIIFLVLDTFCAFAEIYVSWKSQQFRGLKAYSKALQSFLKFTTLLFSIEIFLVYVAFGLASLFHLGYLCDLTILLTQLYLDSQGRGSEIHLLNIFRVWRPMRLLNAVAASEREQRLAIEQKLSQLQGELQSHQTEIETLKDTLTKEKETNKAVENMLQSYKEEVDTLNEALKIAAMDIAEVGQADDDLFTSEDESADESSQFNAAAKLENSSLSGSVTDSGKAEHKAIKNDISKSISDSSKSTFVVHEDGRFERK